jgi:hypothetical protein
MKTSQYFNQYIEYSIFLGPLIILNIMLHTGLQYFLAVNAA